MNGRRWQKSRPRPKRVAKCPLCGSLWHPPRKRWDGLFDRQGEGDVVYSECVKCLKVHPSVRAALRRLDGRVGGLVESPSWGREVPGDGAGEG